MGYTIAMAGKGGTGKTTLAALIVRIIKERKLGSILAVDADPNSNLAEALGMKQGSSIGRILDELARHPDKVPSGMPKDRFLEYEIQTAISEGEGFDLLTMGRPEGPGCYCYVNNILRNVVARLIKDYDYVVIDNEAGLEHLSRRTSRSADALVVVADATKPGLTAARRISELAEELEIQIKKKLLLINRAEDSLPRQQLEDCGLKYLGDIPLDSEIKEISFDSGSLMSLKDDARSLLALRKLGESIWQKN